MALENTAIYIQHINAVHLYGQLLGQTRHVRNCSAQKGGGLFAFEVRQGWSGFPDSVSMCLGILGHWASGI